MHEKIVMRRFFGAIVTGVLLVVAIGCGSVQHKVRFQDGYKQDY